jgi:hypothetical protein
MPRAEPLITPEELHSLLGGAPARSNLRGSSRWHNMQTLHGGAALWLVKGIFLYAVLMNPEAAQLVGNNRYLWMRCGLELVCLALFWGGSMHPRGRRVAHGSMLVASTTWLMDAMTLWAFAG